MLFIDEADVLCGRRGEVRYGGDRYANAEVGHMLQRLEDHEGLVILASNLRENMDAAFLRRLHISLSFPRPAYEERLRLWRWVFQEAPLDQAVDLEGLRGVRVDRHRHRRRRAHDGPAGRAQGAGQDRRGSSSRASTGSSAARGTALPVSDLAGGQS